MFYRLEAKAQYLTFPAFVPKPQVETDFMGKVTVKRSGLMGYEFYVCKKCLKLQSGSDLGHHEQYCDNEVEMNDTSKKRYINKLNKDIKCEFGNYYLSSRHCYNQDVFDFFYNSVDWWVDNRNKKHSKEYEFYTNIIKHFMYGVIIPIKHMK
eukprot:gene8469-291_t